MNFVTKISSHKSFELAAKAQKKNSVRTVIVPETKPLRGYMPAYVTVFALYTEEV